MDRARAILQPRERLRRRPGERCTVKVHVDRPEEARAARHRHPVRRQRQRLRTKLHRKAHVRVRCHRILPDMVVDEQEARARVRSHRPAKRSHIRGGCRQPRRRMRSHRRQAIAICGKERMDRPQRAAHRIDLAILAERCLEVVADLRHVVVPARRLRLLDRTTVDQRVRAAVEHVIAEQIDARTELRGDRCPDVARRHDRAAAIHHWHAGAIFRAEERRIVRVILGVAARPPARLRAEIAAHPAAEAEQVILLGRQRPGLGRPGLVDIATHHRQHLPARIDRMVPAGDGIERHVEPDPLRQRLQRRDMLTPLARAVEIIFILDLKADHRAAVFPQQPPDLFVKPAPEAVDLGEIRGIVAARSRARDDPIGDAAEARLGMRPRSGTEEQQQPVLAAELGKAAQIAVAREVEPTGRQFELIPDRVGRHDVDPRGLHLEQFRLPLGRGRPREVKLAHHRQPRLAIARQIEAVDADRAARAGSGPHEQMGAAQRRRRLAGIDLNNRLPRRGSRGEQRRDTQQAGSRGPDGARARSANAVHTDLPIHDVSRGVR